MYDISRDVCYSDVEKLHELIKLQQEQIDSLREMYEGLKGMNNRPCYVMSGPKYHIKT